MNLVCVVPKQQPSASTSVSGSSFAARNAPMASILTAVTMVLLFPALAAARSSNCTSSQIANAFVTSISTTGEPCSSLSGGSIACDTVTWVLTSGLPSPSPPVTLPMSSLSSSATPSSSGGGGSGGTTTTSLVSVVPTQNASASTSTSTSGSSRRAKGAPVALVVAVVGMFLLFPALATAQSSTTATPTATEALKTPVTATGVSCTTLSLGTIICEAVTTTMAPEQSGCIVSSVTLPLIMATFMVLLSWSLVFMRLGYL
ncbi:hypothetical protein NA57DRAFT_58634 [Rhizodiscina lignyota]|uniref:Uncharacterized protein n=1 Tax=Rhizodiscina lignyota TaxID=1504668 RepID=A0A9P4I7Q0_9PEZI|nr:hypothetical protein NA57DRAFT_58634 [Rhizodiscina lignyota]